MLVDDSEKQEYSPIGDDVMEFIDSLLTPEEIEKSNRRVARIGKKIEARQRRKRKREELLQSIKKIFRSWRKK